MRLSAPIAGARRRPHDSARWLARANRARRASPPTNQLSLISLPRGPQLRRWHTQQGVSYFTRSPPFLLLPSASVHPPGYVSGTNGRFMGTGETSRTAAHAGCRDCGLQNLEHYYTCAEQGYTLCPACFEQEVGDRRGQKKRVFLLGECSSMRTRYGVRLAGTTPGRRGTSG